MEPALRLYLREGQSLGLYTVDAENLMDWRALGCPGGGEASLVYGPAGKPAFGLEGPWGQGSPPPCWSRSHSGHVLAIAMGDKPLGLDIERPRPMEAGRMLAVLARVHRDLAESGQVALDRGGIGALEAFFWRNWVALEALAKVRGGGMAQLLGQMNAAPMARDSGILALDCSGLAKESSSLAMRSGFPAKDSGSLALASISAAMHSSPRGMDSGLLVMGDRGLEAFVWPKEGGSGLVGCADIWARPQSPDLGIWGALAYLGHGGEIAGEESMGLQ